MKTNNYIFVLLCLLATTAASAKSNLHYTVAISTDTIRIIKGHVNISLTFDLGERIIYSQHKRIITPVICTADRDQQLSLPAIVVNGHNRSIKELRTKQNAEQLSDTYVILTGNKQANRFISYHTQVDYQPWMEQAHLILRQDVLGCACGGLLEDEQIAKNNLLYIPQLRVSPEMECPKDFVQRKIQKDAFLIYPVNQTRLYPDRYGNHQELQKIDSAMNYVRFNPDYEIRRIDIAGFASPEGSYTHNVKLAQGRAEALKAYILKNYTTDPNLIAVCPGAENWDGLTQILVQSQLPYKEQILQIIDSIANPDQREIAIQHIAGGQPYQTLLTTVYPNLRKNTFTISYISRERTPEAARTLALSQPQELNAYEFYTVAHRFYSDDSDTYRRLLLTAADTYPDNAVACNNAAGICLTRGDYEQAERYLSQTANEAFTWNNRAYLLWMKGEKEEAAIWWEKAAGQGDLTAKYNLKELEKR
jgi:outer membrane protein OmpA-like peptidoglycan-associated protein